RKGELVPPHQHATEAQASGLHPLSAESVLILWRSNTAECLEDWLWWSELSSDVVADLGGRQDVLNGKFKLILVAKVVINYAVMTVGRTIEAIFDIVKPDDDSTNDADNPKVRLRELVATSHRDPYRFCMRPAKPSSNSRLSVIIKGAQASPIGGATRALIH